MKVAFSDFQAKWLPGLTAALLHCIACVAFAEAGAAVRFTIAQPIVAAATGYVIYVTLCWKWQAFGDPRKLPNFIAHITFFFAVFFLLSSLYSEAPDTTSCLDLFAQTSQWVGKLLFKISPAVFDVIRSPGIALLFIAVCVALAIPRRDAASWIFVFVSFVAVILGLTSKAIAFPGWILVGIVSMGCGLALLHYDPTEARFWDFVVTRLRGDRALAGDLELKLRLLQRMRQLDNSLPDRLCLGVVARAISQPTNSPAVRELTTRVVGQLIEQDHLAVAVQTPEGRSLALSGKTQLSPESGVAEVFKAVLILLLVLVWVLSPVDLWPDALPFGAIDDAFVALLGGGVFYKTMIEFRRRRADPSVIPDRGRSGDGTGVG